MRLAYESAAVRVPATTANMGPGFDSFGMAFRFFRLRSTPAAIISSVFSRS